MLPEELLERAMKATGEGLTPTLRKALELVAAKDRARFYAMALGSFRESQSILALAEQRSFRDQPVVERITVSRRHPDAGLPEPVTRNLKPVPTCNHWL